LGGFSFSSHFEFCRQLVQGLGGFKILGRYACLPYREASKDLWEYPTIPDAQDCLVPELTPADCKFKIAAKRKHAHTLR